MNQRKKKYYTFIKLPYLGCIDSCFKKIFMETTSLKICNTSNNQLKNIFTSNYENTKNDNQFNMIYKYQCKCNNSYIGTTKNKNQRIYQHDLNVRNKNVNHSALTEHLRKS